MGKEHLVNEFVVGVDDSHTARKAAAAAAELASETGDPLHVVMCVDRKARNITVGGETFHLDSVNDAQHYLTSLKLSLGAASVTNSVRFDDPAGALCEEAERLDARMIVVGNRRVKGASRVLGSVAVDVIRKAPCAVLVVNTTGGDDD